MLVFVSNKFTKRKKHILQHNISIAYSFALEKTSAIDLIQFGYFVENMHKVK